MNEKPCPIHPDALQTRAREVVIETHQGDQPHRRPIPAWCAGCEDD